MKILFIHRTFPAQFEYLIHYLLKNKDNEISFITNNKSSKEITGVKKYIYDIEETSKTTNEYISGFEDAVAHSKSVFLILEKLKKEGYKPDLIYGFSGWGSSMFAKEVYPEVPYLCYFEHMGRINDSIYDFGNKEVSSELATKIKCSNANILIDLESCDGGITPTKWQKKLFPKAYQGKIKVLHEGINTSICKPDKSTTVHIEDKGLTLGINDEVITYGTRGIEEYRGFPQFMKALEILQKKRPKMHAIIAGADKVFYGQENISYKEKMENELDLDMSRIHFTGVIPFESYIGILQISSAHIYLTYPMMLSWSLLNAMSTGCCIVASDTNPVKEFITDNQNGLLTDFFDTNSLVEKIEFAIEHKNIAEQLGINARKLIIEKYSQDELLPKHLGYIESFLK